MNSSRTMGSCLKLGCHGGAALPSYSGPGSCFEPELRLLLSVKFHMLSSCPYGFPPGSPVSFNCAKPCC